MGVLYFQGSKKAGMLTLSLALETSAPESHHIRNGSNEPVPTFHADDVRKHLTAPLPMTRQMEDRIQILGPNLPMVHKWMLWVGVLLDIACKVSPLILLANNVI